MHCLRDEDALIPRPRGSLPKICAALLATIAVAGILRMSPGRLINLVALAALIVTLGPLLHGVCLLAEEVLHHSNTRLGCFGVCIKFQFCILFYCISEASILPFMAPLMTSYYLDTSIHKDILLSLYFKLSSQSH
ncbi:hypothetical protein AMECASPLE_032545 [Ameca splendens]|uniref:STING transmembrane domain-containing protein n=1 Tax=Ameca splendens TaxID=208324 RepID=A0ABV1ACZ9_9TELE